MAVGHLFGSLALPLERAASARVMTWVHSDWYIVPHSNAILILSDLGLEGRALRA